MSGESALSGPAWGAWGFDRLRRRALDRGDFESALVHSQNSLAWLERLSAGAPESAALQRDRALLLQNHALVLERLKREEEAKAHEEAACAVSSGLFTEVPSDRGFLRDHLSCLFDQSRAARDRRDRDASLAALAKIQELAERAAVFDQGQSFPAAALAKVEHERAELHTRLDQDPPRAAEAYRESLARYAEIFQDRAAALPEFDDLGNLTRAYLELLERMEQDRGMQQPPERVTDLAVEVFRQFAACGEVLGGASSCGQAAWWAGLFAGERMNKEGRYDEAADLFEGVVKLVETYQSHPYYARLSEPALTLCQSRNQLGLALRHTERAGRAIEMLGDNALWCRDQSNRFPDDLRLRGQANRAAQFQAEALRAHGDDEAARRVLETCVAAYGSDCYESYATMLEQGEGGPVDPERAQEVRAIRAYTNIKRFTINVYSQEGNLPIPFEAYIFERPPDWPFLGIEDQAIWLERERGMSIFPEIRQVFIKLEEIAQQNKVSFPDLAAHAWKVAPANAQKE